MDFTEQRNPFLKAVEFFFFLVTQSFFYFLLFFLLVFPPLFRVALDFVYNLKHTALKTRIWYFFRFRAIEQKAYVLAKYSIYNSF